MSRMDHGTVRFDLDGKGVELVPTLRAMRAINRQFGGIRGAMDHVQRLDFEAFAALIAAGANIKNKADREDMEEALFRHGITNVAGPVTDYLVGLLDPTGKERSGEESDDEGKA